MIRIIARLVAKTAAQSLKQTTKSAIKTTAKQSVLSRGKNIPIKYIPEKVVKKTTTKTTKNLIKTGPRKLKKELKARKQTTLGDRLLRLDEKGKKLIKTYNNVKQLEQYYSFSKQVLSGDIFKPQRVAYYLRDYFKDIDGVIQRGDTFEKLSGFYNIDSGNEIYDGDESKEAQTTTRVLKAFVVSSWQYFGEFLYMQGEENNNTTGIMTIYLIPEKTANASPFIHTDIPMSAFDEWKNAPSVGQYWWYQIRTGNVRKESNGCSLDDLNEWLDNNKDFDVPKGMSEALKQIDKKQLQLQSPEIFTRKYMQQSMYSVSKHLDIGLPQEFIEDVMVKTAPKKINSQSWNHIKRQNIKMANKLNREYGIDIGDYVSKFNETNNIFSKELFNPKDKNSQINALENIRKISFEAWKESQNDFLTKNSKLFNKTILNNKQTSYKWKDNVVYGSTKNFIFSKK